VAGSSARGGQQPPQRRGRWRRRRRQLPLLLLLLCTIPCTHAPPSAAASAEPLTPPPTPSAHTSPPLVPPAVPAAVPAETPVSAAAAAAGGTKTPGVTYPLFLPDPDNPTKLAPQKAGLDFVTSISGKVAIVAAIGPFRSGKSFLLNQLMGQTCARGFGVGHKRQAMTKGIWLWGEPEVVEHGGEKISMLFMDTEGMEGTGRTSAYDDRIFALASMLSSVLIYNLPETVKESDIQKLSFAVELSEEFFRRLKGDKTEFAFPTLIWRAWCTGWPCCLRSSAPATHGAG
jgi:hypothetical protein